MIRVDGASSEPVGGPAPVLQEDGLILLWPFPWEGVRQTTHDMAEECVRYVFTLYVEPRVSWNFDGRISIGGFIGIMSRQLDLVRLLEVARAFPIRGSRVVGPIGGREREALDQLRTCSERSCPRFPAGQ